MIYEPMTEIDLKTEYPTFDIFTALEGYLSSIDSAVRPEVKDLVDQAQRYIFRRYREN